MAEAPGGAASSGAKRPDRSSGETTVRLASNAASATASGSSAGCPVATARSQVWVAVSSRLIEASIRPGMRPGRLSTTRSSTPGARHATRAAAAAAENWAAGSEPSANGAGGRDPAALDQVPHEILAACGAVVDAGRLPGTPSTVIDFTGPKPVVLREGPAPADEAIARAHAALRR